MSVTPRSCPKCRANLASVPIHDGKLRCPECGALLAVGRADDRLQTTPTTNRSSGRTGDRSPKAAEASRRAAPQQSSNLPVVLILVGLGLGLFFLLVVGGGIVAYFYFSQTPPTSTVASNPVEAPPNDPPVVQPKAQAAVEPVQPHPRPAPQPIEPDPGPPVEPIKPAAAEQAGRGGSNTLPLKELKAATVFVRVVTPVLAASGSGFVVHAQGNTVFVATNHHVIHPKPPKDPAPPRAVPQTPRLPSGPRVPTGPRMPFGPRFPRRGKSIEEPPGLPVAGITVVFYSGTAKEQALSATVVVEDAVRDLAILRVTGVVDVPHPINYLETPELHETMPVVMFGFPLGRLLDQKKKYPAITVAKGSISALREAGGQLNDVQLDIDMPGGYSGGPVVDEKGVLIGVAYAGWDNTQINYAIPVHKLKSLLQGRIDPPNAIESLTVGGRRQSRVRAPAADPLGKLRSPTLLYGLANEVRISPRMNGVDWPPLIGAKTSPMKVEGTQAVATLDLTAPANGQLQIIAQASYQTANGQTIHGEPKTLNLGATNPPPPAVARAQATNPAPAQGPAVAPRPTKTPRGEELTKILADLKSKDEATRQRAASVLQQAPPFKRREEVRSGLQNLLTAADPATRTAGVLALAVCDPKEAAPNLAKLLADNTPAVRQAVVKSLKDLRDPRTAEALAARLPVEPLAVLDALKAIGPAAEKAVLPYLDNKYAGGTRFWICNLLNEIGTEASLPALEAVQGPDALHANGVVKNIRGRLPLSAGEWQQALDDLKSTDAALRVTATRRMAATAPSNEHSADVVSRFEWLLNDQSGDVRIAAAKGLARWAGPKAIPLLSKRLEGFDPPMHAALIDVLAEMKTDEAAVAIAKRLPDVHDRGKATQALRAMDAKVAEKAVLPLLANTDVFVRCEAVKVLGIVGSRDSIAPLEKLANDNNAFYSGLARQALESIKDRSEEEH